MINDEPTPEELRKFFHALRRAQRHLDLRSGRRPQPAVPLQPGFSFGEVIFVDLLNPVSLSNANPYFLLDHETGELDAVDEDDPLCNPRCILARKRRY